MMAKLKPDKLTKVRGSESSICLRKFREEPSTVFFIIRVDRRDLEKLTKRNIQRERERSGVFVLCTTMPESINTCT